MNAAALSKVADDWRTPLAVAGAALTNVPFRYAAIPHCLDLTYADRIMAWFEGDAPWRLVETDFYEQYEFSLSDTSAAEARLLTDTATLSTLRLEMSRLFGVEFQERVRVVAHKLMPGQRIAIHNDYLAGEETHRLVVQLNSGLVDEDGGFLMLFNSDNPRDVHKIFRPVHLSGLAFEISSKSFHAVSRMHGSVRYTIVFSFYCVDGYRDS